mgnify:CR=1 FL=1
MPGVNKDLFIKLQADKMDPKPKKKKKEQENLLEDSRFSSLFTDKNFEVKKEERSTGREIEREKSELEIESRKRRRRTSWKFPDYPE